MRLLLAEDDVTVASGIKLGLTGTGYAVDRVCSAERALEVTPIEPGPREWTVMEYLMLKAPNRRTKTSSCQH